MKALNNSLIVAERFYHPVLFRFKNQNPELDVKIITPAELLDKLTFRFKKDPIPYYVSSKKIEYSKAKKWVNILRTANLDNNNELKSQFNELKDEYIAYDQFGLYELKQRHIFLFEMDEEKEIKNLLKRKDINFENLTFKDIKIEEKNSFKIPKCVQFSNKIVQFFNIFADIRERLSIDEKFANRIKIIVDSDADLFYVRMCSSLFKIPVYICVSHSLLSNDSIKNKINEIYSNKSFDCLEVNENEYVEYLKMIVEKYSLNTLDFDFAYSNLLEIISSNNVDDRPYEKGITITTDFNFDPNAIVYVTNFQYGSFYKVFSDNNVLNDSELESIGCNPSYTKTELDRRAKLNYMKYNDIVLFSRVEQHLSDAIYDSQFVEELGWKNKIIKVNDIKQGSVTNEVAKLLLCNQLDKKYFTGVYEDCNSYDHSFKGIGDKTFYEPRKWSVTNLETYIDCPYKYYLSQLIPTQDDDFHSRCRGVLIHSIYERMYYPDFDFEKEFEKGTQEYKKCYESYGGHYGAKEEAYIAVMKYWLSKMVISYKKINQHMNRIDSFDGLPEFEKLIDFVLYDSEKNPYYFTGRIDKILSTKNGDDVFYTIIDYKTGLEKFNPSTVCLGKSIQLPLYYYGIENHIQPSIFNNGGKFGGFGIQTVFYSTITGAYKDTKGWMTEKELLSSGRIGGIALGELSYLKSIDDTIEIAKNGNIKPGKYVNTKDRTFSSVNSEESNLVEDNVLEHYNVNDIVDDSIKSAIRIIKNIRKNKFDIRPTSAPDSKYDPDKLTCNICAYKDICYHNIKDAKDYTKVIKLRFTGDPDWDTDLK